MRIFSFFLGLALIALMIVAGYYTNANPDFVVWFGVITALVSPLAFELLIFPFRAKNQALIQDLARIPKIESLIKEAKDNEEKIKILEKQKEELDKLIAYESKRRALEAEKEIFIIQGKEAIRSLNRVNSDLNLLTDERHKLPEVLKPLLSDIYGNDKNIIKYRVNGVWYYMKRSSFAMFPLYGLLFFDLLKAFEQLFLSVDKKNEKLNQ